MYEACQRIHRLFKMTRGRAALDGELELQHGVSEHFGKLSDFRFLAFFRNLRRICQK